jgi:hypothetical protein
MNHHEVLKGKLMTKTNQALVAGRERRRKERRRAIALLPEVRYFDPKRLELRAIDGDGSFQSDR